jgi:hypothetical protein
LEINRGDDELFNQGKRTGKLFKKNVSKIPCVESGTRRSCRLGNVSSGPGWVVEYNSSVAEVSGRQRFFHAQYDADAGIK